MRTLAELSDVLNGRAPLLVRAPLPSVARGDSPQPVVQLVPAPARSWRMDVVRDDDGRIDHVLIHPLDE